MDNAIIVPQLRENIIFGKIRVWYVLRTADWLVIRLPFLSGPLAMFDASSNPAFSHKLRRQRYRIFSGTQSGGGQKT
jgi:hypothetical protein